MFSVENGFAYNNCMNALFKILDSGKKKCKSAFFLVKKWLNLIMTNKLIIIYGNKL